MFSVVFRASRVQMEEETVEAHGATMMNGNGNGAVTSTGQTVRVGVVFSGRQAAGGHNIIWGLHNFLKGSDGKASIEEETHAPYVSTKVLRQGGVCSSVRGRYYLRLLGCA